MEDDRQTANRRAERGPGQPSPWQIAAVNYNETRVPGSAYCEATDGKLGSVYTALTETLVMRGDWNRLFAERDRATDVVQLPDTFNLLLGTAQGKGIAWNRLGYGIWPPPLANYVHGFESLTRKGRLVRTLAAAREAYAGRLPPEMPRELASGAALGSATDPWDICPVSFVFSAAPSRLAANPYEQLRDAVARDPSAMWILKPTDGCKGEGIVIRRGWKKIAAELSEHAASGANGERSSAPAPPPRNFSPSPPCMCIQRYIGNPLLLERGRRKFDIRCWVLIDAEYGIHLFDQGVLRVSSVPYDPSDVSNRYSHLTNHCIAATHGDYGKYEPTNELFYPAFDAELNARFPQAAARAGGSVLHGLLIPQMKRMVVQTLLAARGNLRVATDYYSAFQLLGYDFLIDDELRAWLCEINASPAVADELLAGLVDALIQSAVDPYCPPIEALIQSTRGGRTPARREADGGRITGRFERLYPERSGSR